MNRVTFLEKSSVVRSSRLLFSPLLALTSICLWALISVGCDSDDGGDEDAGGQETAGMMNGGVEEGGEMGGAEGGAQVVEGEAYLTYTRVVSEGTDTRGDLMAFRVRTQTELWLNEGMSRDDIDCVTYGCVLHPALSHVAWIKRVGADGELWLAPINKDEQRVEVAEKRMLSDTAVGLSFSPNKLYFTEVKDPSARQGIAVKSVPLDGGEATEHDLVDDNGGLSVGRDDDILIIIKTDLSSMTLTLRNLSNEQILELMTFGEPGGTGSPFAASSNPVTLSPQGDYMSIITSNDFVWRLHTLPSMGGDLETRELFPVTSSEDACTGALPFTQVLGAPKTSLDGEHLYLLFGGDCTQREVSTSNRRDYDIYRFSRDLSAEPLNVTRIIAFNGWSNHDISSFDVSPDDTKVAFTATRPNKSGVKGIWLQEITEGGEEDQTVFDCSRDPNPNPLTDIVGQRRCEYIVYDVEPGGTVEYRALDFVTAEGL